MRKISSIIFILFFILFTINSVSEANAANPSFNAVLVHDVSGSMFNSDPNEISLDAMKMFVDLCDYGLAKIGVVTFSDEIVGRLELTDIADEKDKLKIKEHIGKMTFTDQNTDTGLALSTAFDVLQKGAGSENQLIVLLSDGKTALNNTNERTIEQSKNDVADVISKAKENGIPIYTIGLNCDGTVDRDELSKIASETNGNYYETTDSSDLTDILKDIFARHKGLTNINISDKEASGALETIDVIIPDSTVLSANIIVTAPGSIKQAHLFNPAGHEIPIPSDKVLYSSGKSYYIYKIISPEKGTWKFQFQGVEKDKIRVDLIMSRDFSLILNVETDTANSNFAISTSLIDQNGSNINDMEIYQSSEAFAYIINQSTGIEEKVALDYSQFEYSGKYNYPNDGLYAIRTELINGYLNFISDDYAVDTSSFSLVTQAPTAQPSATATAATPPPATQAPTQTTETEQEPTKSMPALYLILIILAAVLTLVILIISIYLLRKRFNTPVFTYGKLNVIVNGVGAAVPPFVWSFETLSYKKRLVYLCDILEKQFGNAGFELENVFDVAVIKKLAQTTIRLHKTGGLLLMGLDEAFNVTGADAHGKNSYVFYDGVSVNIYFETGGNIVLRYIED